MRLAIILGLGSSIRRILVCPTPYIFGILRPHRAFVIVVDHSVFPVPLPGPTLVFI